MSTTTDPLQKPSEDSPAGEGLASSDLFSVGHRIEFVEGDFDMQTGELVCVQRPKYGEVRLCFKAGMNIPFASIKLHTRDRAVDADAVFDDAVKLGDEIARRWNHFQENDQS